MPTVDLVLTQGTRRPRSPALGRSFLIQRSMIGRRHAILWRRVGASPLRFGACQSGPFTRCAISRRTGSVRCWYRAAIPVVAHPMTPSQPVQTRVFWPRSVFRHDTILRMPGDDNLVALLSFENLTPGGFHELPHTLAAEFHLRRALQRCCRQRLPRAPCRARRRRVRSVRNCQARRSSCGRRCGAVRP